MIKLSTHVLLLATIAARPYSTSAGQHEIDAARTYSLRDGSQSTGATLNCFTNPLRMHV